ncbi:DUF4019 domain-containing protein [Lysobacter terrae]
MKKMHMLCAALFAACWYGSAAAAPMAMAPMQSASTQPQATQRDTDPGEMAKWGLQVLGMIDSQQAGMLWDGASQVTKQAVGRADFVTKVAQSRKALGAPASHVWMAVRRQLVTQKDQGAPPGFYATMEFVTTFQNNQALVEVVSLRRDEDGRWRFAGYFTK